jgi:hypothetical protein
MDSNSIGFADFTNLLDLMYTVKTMQCYFTFYYFTFYYTISVPEEYKALFVEFVSFFYTYLCL